MKKAKKYLSVVIIGFLISSGAKSQEKPLTIKFPDTPKTTSDGSIEYIIKGFGNTLTYDDSPVHITYPEDFAYKDTGLIKLYFLGSNDTMPFPESTFALVGGYKQPRPTLYVDFNNNLDFSDDGPGQRFSKADTSVRFRLHNASDPEATFDYKIERLKIADSGTRARIKKQFSEKDKIAKFKYWLSDIRYNSRIADEVINGDSVKVGIQDYNCNGFFNDSLEENHDRIMIAGPEQAEVSNRLNKGAYVANPGKIIEINDQYYKLKKVHPYGQHLKLKPTNKSANRIFEGDTIPDFEFSTLQEDTVNLYQKLDKGKYTLIDIWGSWCPGCWLQVSDLKALKNDFPQKLTILGLNWGDKIADAKKFKRKNGITWFTGKADQKIIDTLLVDGYPYYVLVSPDKKIIALNPDFGGIRDLLNKQE